MHRKFELSQCLKEILNGTSQSWHDDRPRAQGTRNHGLVERLPHTCRQVLVASGRHLLKARHCGESITTAESGQRKWPDCPRLTALLLPDRSRLERTRQRNGGADGPDLGIPAPR